MAVLRSRWLASTLLALALLVPANLACAQAAPRTFSLNWVRSEGAEQCASSQLLARAIEQWLGPVLRPASEAEVAIEGLIARAGSGSFTVQARVLTPSGEVIGARSFTRAAPRCSALTPAILLVLTLTLDPEAAAHGFPTELLARLASAEDPGAALLAELDAERGEPAPVVEPRSAPVLAPNTTALLEARPPVTKLPARAWSGSLQLAAAGVLGLLPRVSGGPSVAAELVTPWRLALILGAQYWLPTEVGFDSSGTRKHVRFSAMQGQLSLCLPLAVRQVWRLAGCLGGALGARWVDAHELTSEGHERRLYGGPAAQVSLRYAFNERWFAPLDLSGALLFRRDRFTYRDVADESQLLFAPQPGAVWFALGVGVQL